MKLTRTWIFPVLGLTLVLFIAQSAFAQPPVPHVEEKNGVLYEDCVSCHRTGQNGAPLSPDDHTDYENGSCRLCHETAETLPAEVPTAEAFPTETLPTLASPTETPPADLTPVEIPPPNIPHPVAGWEDCRGCHDRWQGEEITIPNLAESEHDHASYENTMCLTCHGAYDKRPPVACGVCHPRSAAEETIHNGSDNWVDCLACHQGADTYPYGPEQARSSNEDCTSCHPEPYFLSTHIARGDLHLGIDCSACHLQVASVERDPTTGRTQVVRPKTADSIPPDNPELGIVGGTVDCQRCHILDNRIAAPASELPPRSILCMACHDASPIVQDSLSLIGTVTFSLGMLMIASIWLQGSAGGQQSLSLRARLWHILGDLLRLVTTRRLFVFLRSLVADGILHRRLFRESRLRWLAHTCMFFGMAARMALGILTWLMTELTPLTSLTQTLVNKNAPAIALIYDVLGLAVVLGAGLAVIRRYIIKDKQLITGQQDTVAIALIAAIFLMGFVVEGGRLLTTDLPVNLATFPFVGYFVSLVLRLVPANWEVVYGWLWYIHTGLVTALVAYLPFGKFMHVLISPVVVALNSALKAR